MNLGFIYKASDPLKWIIDHQSLSSDFNYDEFCETILKNCEDFTRINKIDFSSELQKVDLKLLKIFRRVLIDDCIGLLPNTHDYVAINKVAPKRICDDIYLLMHIFTNQKSPKLETIKHIFNVVLKDNNNSSKTHHSPQSQATPSFSEPIDPVEEAHFILEEFKFEVSKKFEDLMIEFYKLKEDNTKLKLENDNLILRISALESKTLVTNSSSSTTSKKKQEVMVSSATVSCPSTSVSSTPSALMPDNFSFNFPKLNENQNIFNPYGKRSFANIAGEQKKEEIKPSSNNSLINRNLPKQRKLLDFNSFQPNSQTKPININSNEGFQVAGKRPNKSNNNNKNKNWLKSAGTKDIESFKVAERQCTIYIGRVDLTMKSEDIENLLTTLNIKFSNIKPINTSHNKFKSFTFSINYMDKNIIYQKELWPKGLIINRYFYNKNNSPSTNIPVYQVNQNANTKSSVQQSIINSSSADSLSSMAQNSSMAQCPTNSVN